MVQQTVDAFGRLDTLVNNAGVMLLGPIVGAPVEEWRRMVELNLLGLLYSTHAALPHLLAAAESGPRNVADVVNISSVAGRVARTGNGVYSATKFGGGGLLGVAAPGGDRPARPGLPRRAGGDRHRTGDPQPSRGAGAARRQRSARSEILQAADIADAIAFTVTRPRHVAVNEVLVRPTEQER